MRRKRNTPLISTNYIDNLIQRLTVTFCSPVTFKCSDNVQTLISLKKLIINYEQNTKKYGREGVFISDKTHV